MQSLLWGSAEGCAGVFLAQNETPRDVRRKQVTPRMEAVMQSCRNPVLDAKRVTDISVGGRTVCGLGSRRGFAPIAHPTSRAQFYSLHTNV